MRYKTFLNPNNISDALLSFRLNGASLRTRSFNAVNYLDIDDSLPDNLIQEALEPTHPRDALYIRQADAENKARSIPDWATWSESQANAWYQTNIRDPFNAATTLAAMKAVIGALIQTQWAIIRMVLALRNKSFSNL